jgi:hypothetical protein
MGLALLPLWENFGTSQLVRQNNDLRTRRSLPRPLTERTSVSGPATMVFSRAAIVSLSYPPIFLDCGEFTYAWSWDIVSVAV